MRSAIINSHLTHEKEASHPGGRISRWALLLSLAVAILCAQGCYSGNKPPVTSELNIAQYEGHIIKAKDPGAAPEDQKIFLVTNGKKRWILSMDWFKNGENHGEIVLVPRAELSRIPDGETLP